MSMCALLPLRSRPAGALRLGRLVACGLAAWLAMAAAHAQAAVAVWDFDDQSPLASSGSTFLKRSLSESLTAALLQVGGLPVVERQRLKDLLAEQQLAAGTLADESARLRLGRIAGAGRMVFGGYFVLGSDVQVHVRVIDTATSRVLFSDETSAPVASVMQQVEPLNRRLAQAMAGKSAGADATARSHAPELWQRYDHALGLADAGRYDEAVQALQNLLAHDAGFAPAERQLVALLDKIARR